MSQITGKIIALFDEQRITDKFSKKEIVVETTDQYPQQIIIQFTNKNIEKLNGLKVGDDVTVDYNLKGKSFTRNDGTTGYFNTIEGWKVSSNSSASTSAPMYAQPSGGFASDDDSDLPFRTTPTVNYKTPIWQRKNHLPEA